MFNKCSSSEFNDLYFREIKCTSGQQLPFSGSDLGNRRKIHISVLRLNSEGVTFPLFSIDLSVSCPSSLHVPLKKSLRKDDTRAKIFLNKILLYYPYVSSGILMLPLYSCLKHELCKDQYITLGLKICEKASEDSEKKQQTKGFRKTKTLKIDSSYLNWPFGNLLCLE